MSRVRAVGEEDFDAVVLAAPGIVVISFWASWCAPCATMAPVVGELAEQLAGRARFVAVDVDRAGALATRYDVHLVPTFVVLRDGDLAVTLTGARPKPDLRRELEAVLAGGVADCTHAAGGG